MHKHVCVCSGLCVYERQRDSLLAPDGQPLLPHQPRPISLAKVTAEDTRRAICTLCTKWPQSEKGIAIKPKPAEERWVKIYLEIKFSSLHSIQKTNFSCFHLCSTAKSPLDGSPTPVYPPCCVPRASVCVCVKKLAAVILLTMINGPIQR